MPAGARVPLIHKGQLTVCPVYGNPFLSPSPDGSDSDKTGTGLDANLLTLIGQRMSAVPLVQPSVEPEDIYDYDALGHKACDVVAGAVTADPHVGDASIPYFKDSLALLTRASKSPASLASLAGKRVGAESGSSAARYLDNYNKQHGDAIHVDHNVGDEAAFTFMLQEKKVDAILTTRGIAMDLAYQADGRLRATSVNGPTWKIVFLVRHGNKGLLTQINEALADAVRNGQYARSYYAYFGSMPTWQPGQS